MYSFVDKQIKKYLFTWQISLTKPHELESNGSFFYIYHFYIRLEEDSSSIEILSHRLSFNEKSDFHLAKRNNTKTHYYLDPRMLEYL